MRILKECITHVKYIIYGFNLLIMILAIVMICKAEAFKSSARSSEHISYIDTSDDVSTLAIVAGSLTISIMILLTISVAFTPIWEKIRNNNNALIVYVIVLVCLIIITIAVSLLAFTFSFRNSLPEKLEELTNSFKKSYTLEATFQEIPKIKQLQQSMQCCGFSDPRGADVYKKQDKGLLIAICCKGETDPCYENYAFEVSCKDVLRNAHQRSLANLKSMTIISNILVICEKVYAAFIIFFTCTAKKSDLRRPYT